jgi:2-keto-4-pentenoate hydratase/2-oxohepta-3-ene-1,7-dioic acid hydratase in catechol pathway
LKFATYQQGGRRCVGVVTPDGQAVRRLPLSESQAARGVLSVIDLQLAGEHTTPVGEPIPLSQVKLDAPVPRPRRNLWCVGRNYHAHAKELSASIFKDNKTESWPIVFTKPPETVIGPRDPIVLPSEDISTQIDYEAELTIVIGQGGKNIRREDALKHVFGYTIINDVTARDVQQRHQQWDLGKSFDTFCPMGPWVVTADELDGADTRVRCWVNGELRQDGHTRDLIFDIPTLIETCSRGITLLPGDLIATGTCAGVGMGMNPPRWLKAGDVVRMSVDGLGEIENRIAPPRA